MKKKSNNIFANKDDKTEQSNEENLLDVSFQS